MTSYIVHSRSYLARKKSYLARKKIYLRGKNSYLRGRNPRFLAKKEEKTLCLRAFSSSQYKYTTFFAEIQIPLTLRNNSEMLICSDLHKRAFAIYYITRAGRGLCRTSPFVGPIHRRRAGCAAVSGSALRFATAEPDLSGSEIPRRSCSVRQKTAKSLAAKNKNSKFAE